MYKVINNLGHEALGFNTKADAEYFIKNYGREDRTWYVVHYTPDQIEHDYKFN